MFTPHTPPIVNAMRSLNKLDLYNPQRNNNSRMGIWVTKITPLVGREEECNLGWRFDCYKRCGHNAKDQGTLPG